MHEKKLQDQKSRKRARRSRPVDDEEAKEFLHLDVAYSHVHTKLIKIMWSFHNTDQVAEPEGEDVDWTEGEI